jgi:ABC-2 type transport system permease protein
MSASLSSSEQPFRARSNVSASLTALLAIISRDLLVTRREVLIFLAQTLMQPLFFLFIFGKVLTSIGAANASFSTLLLPGIVSLTVFLTAFQGPAVDLARDLGVTREIDDRLLAPLPVALVAVEKMLLAVLRGVIAGALVFPLAYWILGSGYQVRTDLIGVLIGLILLVGLVGAAMGLLMAAITPIQVLPVIFALVFTPLIFTGCVYYPWATLDNIKWFQIITLINPLTYASEGLRYAMMPSIPGAPDTLAIGWVVLALGVCLIACLWNGIRLFHRRVIS